MANALFVTGDTHGPAKHGLFDGYGRRLNTESFPEQKELDREDYVIIAGDFGGIWDYDLRHIPEEYHFIRQYKRAELPHGESKEEKHWLDWLEEKPFTLLFVGGNHENYDRLYHAYPIIDYHGGRAVKIRQNVFMLLNGYLFDLAGKSVFAFGGARSHDISDGILDPANPAFHQDYDEYKETLDYCRQYKTFWRIKHVEWWEEEMPSEEMMKRGMDTLAANDYKADLIISHCAPTSVQRAIDADNEPDQLTDYLQKVMDQTSYKYWVFGHYHDNRQFHFKGEEILLYEQIIRLW